MKYTEQEIQDSLIQCTCKEHGNTLLSTLVCNPEDVPCPQCDDRCHVKDSNNVMMDFKVWDLVKVL